MLTTFLIAIFIASNVSNSIAASADRTWNAGDIFVWGWQDSRVRKWTNIEKNLERTDDETDIGELERNITSIDIVSERYDAINSDYDSIGGETGYTFDADDFVESNLDTTDFFDIDYDWDETANKTVLNDVDFNIFSIYNWLLIDPDWITLNNGFKDSLNRSVILDTLPDPYEPIIYNFTLGYFFDNLTSFKIMGKSDFNKSLEQFTDKMKWTFEFDLSNVIGEDFYNSTSDLWYYVPYDMYVVTLVLEYDSGGILQHYQYKTEWKLTIDDIIEEEINIDEWAIGGMNAVSASIPLYSIISGIFILSVSALVIKRRRN